MTETSGRVFVVVHVTQGVADNAYTFRSRRNAITCLRRLRKGRNLDEDDIQLFETSVGEFPAPELLKE